MQNVRFIALLSTSLMIPLYSAAAEGLFLLVGSHYEKSMTFISVGQQTTIRRLKEKIAALKGLSADDLEIRACGLVLKDNSTVRAAFASEGRGPYDLMQATPYWQPKQIID